MSIQISSFKFHIGLVASLLCLLCIIAKLQTAIISGHTLNSEGQPIISVKIFVLTPDSVVVDSSLSDNLGKYSISLQDSGKFWLQVSKPGYSSIIDKYCNAEFDKILFKNFKLLTNREFLNMRRCYFN